MIEKVESCGRLLGMIVRRGYEVEGTAFITPAGLAQQLAVVRHPAGHSVQAHVHNRVLREITATQEVILMRKGRMRVDFYEEDHTYLESRIVESGDALILIEGGHGFTALEECELFDVKQGPYAGERDKIRFQDVQDGRVRIRSGEGGPERADP